MQIPGSCPSFCPDASRSRTPESEAVAAPNLAVGTTFVFAAKRAYDPDPEKTVVVAKAGPEGYLFAGGDKDDLVYALAWGDELYGETQPDLDHKGGWNYLEFPLRDGATWEVHKGLSVTARAATVSTPKGTEPGFVMEGKNERTHLRYEYAPSVGWWTSYQFDIGGKPFDAYTLKSIGAGSKWIWSAPVTRLYVGDPTMPGTMDVGKADAVAISAGGHDGSRVTVAMPDGQTWAQDFPAGADMPNGIWVNHLFPATSGKWVITVQGHPDTSAAPAKPPIDLPMGWGAASATPVTWITST